MRIIYSFSIFCLLILVSSCTSYQQFLNYNQPPRIPDGPMPITNWKPLTVQSNDILRIRISSLDAEAIKPFIVSSAASGEGVSGYEEFLVNSEGNIEFPTIGTVTVKGLEVEQIQNQIAELLKPYFTTLPIVDVRLANFRIIVNGEVSSPGSFSVYNNRVTVIEAITFAGDFTGYSRRDSVMIIREQDGIRNFGYVDFTSTEVFSSPYFYLQQNDVVYVQPNKGKVNSVRDPSTRVLPWVSVGVSVVLLAITISRL